MWVATIFEFVEHRMTTGTTSANDLVCKLSWSFCNIKRYQYILTIRIGVIRMNHFRIISIFLLNHSCSYISKTNILANQSSSNHCICTQMTLNLINMPSNTQTFPLNYYQAPTKNAMIHQALKTRKDVVRRSAWTVQGVQGR